MQCSSCAVRASTCFAAWRSLKPVLMAEKPRPFGRRALNMGRRRSPLLGHTIRKFKPMLQRIETAHKMVDASKQPESASAPTKASLRQLTKRQE